MALLRRLATITVFIALFSLASALALPQEAQHPLQPEPAAHVETLIAPIHYIFRQTRCSKSYCEGRHVIECFEGREVWSECFEPWVGWAAEKSDADRLS